MIKKHPIKILENLKNGIRKLIKGKHSIEEDVEELEALLLFYHKVIEKLPVAIYLTEGEKPRIMWANKKAKEIFNIELIPESKAEQPLLAHKVHPNDLKNINDTITRLQATPDKVEACTFRVEDSDSPQQYRWNYTLVNRFDHSTSPKFLKVSFVLNAAILNGLSCCKSDPSKLMDDRPADLLTNREKEILRLIAQGYTMRGIADQLKISHHTAGTHRKNLFKKTKVNKTSELIRYAMQNGLG